MNKTLIKLLVPALLLLIAGCAVPPQKQTVPAPSGNLAVTSLLGKARSQTAAGRLSDASVSLERALRIEPRNALLWHELARVRLAQGQFMQAENLAAKSNSLVSGGHVLRRENWIIIGRARTELGDLQGARQAFERAE